MNEQLPITAWLPITKKEIEMRGWSEVDVVIVSGDAYIDHPGFGAAVIGRVLEKNGYKVAIIPQPNWQDDLRDFKKFGKPRLFFGVTAGSMDSMVNHYTAAKRLRSDDAYTPGDQAGFRPDYPTLVYTKILKSLFPETPVILGGIEASMRRLTHYDYWEDRLRPSFLLESGADLLVYGMGERPIVEVAEMLANNKPLHLVQQSVSLHQKQDDYLKKEWESAILLNSHEQCLASKRSHAENFRQIEENSNKISGKTLIQEADEKFVVVRPSYPIMTTEEIDAVYDLPYTRLPHPKYKKRGTIPAYEMIRHSINIHRGCFGGCSFCTISAHQGKEILSRSEDSILRELEKVAEMDDFKGYVSDLGGPSANMYGMQGRERALCEKCKRPSCIFPFVCKNLNTSHEALLNLYKKAAKHPKIKKIFVGSGIRYDLFIEASKDGKSAFRVKDREYLEYLIKNNVSGRLKVAPEHTEDNVLQIMRKPSFSLFRHLKQVFDKINREQGLNQQLIPYFISSHPGCSLEDMKNLQKQTASMGYRLEQVQDFTPTPMTVSTTMYYTGYDPYTMERLYVARNPKDKKEQNSIFFWYKNASKTRRK